MPERNGIRHAAVSVPTMKLNLFTNQSLWSTHLTSHVRSFWVSPFLLFVVSPAFHSYHRLISWSHFRFISSTAFHCIRSFLSLIICDASFHHFLNSRLLNFSFRHFLHQISCTIIYFSCPLVMLCYSFPQSFVSLKRKYWLWLSHFYCAVWIAQESVFISFALHWLSYKFLSSHFVR